MPLGLLDLSIVTDQLIEQLKAYRDASQLWAENRVPPTPSKIEVTGLAPDMVRAKGDGCRLSVFLFHVSVDKFSRNTYPTGGSAQRVPEQPLALDLCFLVTAYSNTDGDRAYVEEQQAMSIALKFFHEHPRITATVPLGSREQMLTLSFEPQTIDEMARLWQAFNCPLRLSALYRVAVAILEPPDAKQPEPVRFPPEVHPEPNTDQAPPGAAILVDKDGYATVRGAGFTNATTVTLRALRLLRQDATPPMRPDRGQFVVVNATTLELRIPESAPPGRYLLHVQAASGGLTVEHWLEVS